MEVGRRIAVIAGVVVVLAGLVVVLLSMGVLQGTFLSGLDRGNLAGNYRYVALGFLLLVVGILLVVLPIFRASGQQSSGVVSSTEMGELRISFKAIESMVISASREISGIREINTRIASVEGGIVIYIRLKVLPDISIPGLAGELQGKVKDYIQEISGAKVIEVKILVENISQEKVQKTVR